MNQNNQIPAPAAQKPPLSKKCKIFNIVRICLAAVLLLLIFMPDAIRRDQHWASVSSYQKMSSSHFIIEAIGFDELAGTFVVISMVLLVAVIVIAILSLAKVMKKEILPLSIGLAVLLTASAILSFFITDEAYYSTGSGTYGSSNYSHYSISYDPLPLFTAWMSLACLVAIFSIVAAILLRKQSPKAVSSSAPQQPYIAPQQPYAAPQQPYAAPQQPYGAPQAPQAPVTQPAMNTYNQPPMPTPGAKKPLISAKLANIILIVLQVITLLWIFIPGATGYHSSYEAKELAYGSGGFYLKTVWKYGAAYDDLSLMEIFGADEIITAFFVIIMVLAVAAIVWSILRLANVVKKENIIVSIAIPAVQLILCVISVIMLDDLVRTVYGSPSYKYEYYADDMSFVWIALFGILAAFAVFAAIVLKMADKKPAPAPQAPYYGAPQQPYMAPQQPYGAPQQPYGAPQQPYGAPQQPYGAPQQPYVAPQQPYVAPQQPYAAPQQPYAAPQQPYAAPQQPYAAPQQP
ncbi:MAG: hypothetical protein IKM08_08870, partial [Clostridia bacterium]|nr:hypothetical protein [Clostridia bacterium]